MIKKKRYITPYVDFSWIEEEELMKGSVIGTVEGDGQPWDKAKESSFIFDIEGDTEPSTNSSSDYEYYINVEY